MNESFLKPKYLLLIGLIALLFGTNPSQDQYYKWVKGQVKEDKAVEVLQMMGFANKEYPKTRIINWKIFSTYETCVDGYDKIFIGIGGVLSFLRSTKVSP